MRFILEFGLPSEGERKALWRHLMPPELPLTSDVKFKALAKEYRSCTGGDISACIFRAASRAALRFGDQRKVSMADLKEVRLYLC